METFGASAYGAFAQQNNFAGTSLVTLNNSSVLTHGDAASGLRATTGGTVNGNQSTVLTEGIGARGLHARDIGSSVNIIGTSVTTMGADAHGALAESGGVITGQNSTLRANGGNASALLVAGDVGRVSSATFTGSTLTSASGPAIAVAGLGNISLTNSSVSAPDQWLRVGTINNFAALAAPEVSLPGVTSPDGDPPIGPFVPPAPLAVTNGLANVTLTNSVATGAAITLPGSVSNVTLASNSLWTMTGSSNLTNLTNDSSLIDFSAPTGDPTLLSSYKTLTAVNYIGAGGTVGLNTFLGSDPSPSDRLVIDGGVASGSSLLRIRNTTGAGALTIGNGILVVDAINAGATVPAAFGLAGPVVAGPYEYTLFRSSVDASNPQAWYLRSTLNCTLAPALPECQLPAPPTDPNYRIEASLYAAIPAMALLYGRNLLDLLHERRGEEEGAGGRANSDGANVGWGRVIGTSGMQRGDALGVLGGLADPHYSYTFLGLQAGMDVYRHDRPDGSRDRAGAYFAIGGDQGRVTHFDGKLGDSNFAAYSLGGYWTHFGPGGWYVDAILQGTFYDISSSANRGLPAFKTAAQGAAASIEGGYPFKLPGGYFIEPQAQLVFQNINIDNASDIAAQVRFTEVNSLAGRFGARFGRTWLMDDHSRSVTAWVRPNLWNEFRGNPTTLFSSEAGFVPFHANLGGLWGELNAGVSGQVTSTTTLYANASYQSRFDGGGFAYNGKVGLRVNW